MSKTRVLIRVFLVLILVTMVGFGLWAWNIKDADDYWRLGEAAVEAEDYAAAEPHLRNLVRLEPEHGEGHKALARALGENAKQPDGKVNVALNREAAKYLGEAARLLPDDIELQKRVLRNLLRTRTGGGAEVAKRVLKVEPENADALYIVAARSVRAGNARSVELLDKLLDVRSLRPFTSLALAEAYHHEDEERRQGILDRAAETAVLIEPDQLTALSEDEHQAMKHLLVMGVSAAKSSQANDRVKGFLSGTKKLWELEKIEAREAADAASQVLAVLEAKLTLPSDASSEATNTRKNLVSELQDIQRLAIAAKTAQPIVYYQLAVSSFADGDYDKAIELLNQGLEAGKELPEDRKKEMLPLRLLAARSLFVLRRYDEATAQLDAVLASDDADEEAKGWAHLLAGGVDTASGRHERALEQYLQGQKGLGQGLLVQMSLANTNLRLRRWSDALPYLAALRNQIGVGTAEERFWASQHDITGASVDWGEARALMALGKWIDAKPRIEALRGTKYESRASASACLFLWQTGKRREAQQLLLTARKKFPKDLVLLQVQVRFLQALKRNEDADNLIAQAAGAEPDDIKLQLLLVRWQSARGRQDEATKMLAEVEKRFPENPAPRVVRAQFLLAKGDSAGALKIADELRKSPETEAVGSLIAASAQLREKDYEQAASQLDAAQGDSQRFGAISLLQGEVAVARGDYGAAIDNLTQSLDVTALRGRSRMSLLRSILLLAQKEGLDKADEVLAPVLRQHPDDPFPLIILADLRFKQGKFDEAMQIIDKVDQLQPGLPNAAYLKAGAYLQVGRVEKTLGELKRALQIDNRHLPSLAMAAQVSLGAGKNADAERYARAALALNPNLWQLYLVRAESLRRQDRIDEAVNLVEGLIKEQPKYLGAHRSLVSLLIGRKRNDLALKACQRGRQQLPEAFVLVMDEMSLRYGEGGEAGLNAAREVANKATSEEPDAAKYLNVARAFSTLGQLQEGVLWAERALDAAKADEKPTVHLYLGEVAMMQAVNVRDAGLNAKARDHFAAVVQYKLKPDQFSFGQFVAGNNLAWLLATEFDQPQKAVEVIEQVKGNWGIGVLPVPFIDTLAEVYRRAERFEDAQKVLDEVLKMRPDEPKLLYQRGKLLLAQNRGVLARNDFDRAMQLELSKEREAEVARILAEMDQASRPAVQPEVPGKAAN